MMRNRILIAAILVIALVVGWYSLNQKNSSDDFLKKQAAQSALFPVLGPVLKDRGAQPYSVIFKADAFGVIIHLQKPLSDHSEREDFRAQIQIATREWAKTRPELQGLHVFIQFQDELESAAK